MQGKIKRFFSFILVIILTLTSLPVFASAAPTYDQVVNAAVYIIISNEGNYTTVLRNDNGALSIGKLGWHATNALNLLKDITAKNPSQALSILGSSLYNEVVTSTYWESRILTMSEASVIAVLLSTAESIEVQDATAKSYVSGYIQHGINLGLSDPAALVFFADFENQNGRTGAANYFREVLNRFGVVTLSTLYECSSKNNRRTKTYNFCLTVNWDAFTNGPGSQTVTDTTPPTISDVAVSDITSKGYTVSCTAADNKELDAVYYAVYYKVDGIDGTRWYKYAPGDGKTSHTVNINEFSSRAGDYCTFIYVFDKAGNYSYVGLNVVTVPEEETNEPFILTVSTVKDGKADREIIWRAKADGGSGEYQYAFALYKDGKIIDMRNFNDFSDYKYTAEENGVYSVMVAAYDSVLGSNASAESPDVNIFDPIVIESVESNKNAAMLGETIKWSTDAHGGEGTLKYSYTIYKDGSAILSTDYSSGSSFIYKPLEGGIYHVTVNVSDDHFQTESLTGNSVTVIQPLTVSDIAFSSDSTFVGKAVTCSAKVSGGSGKYSCVFDIYCDNELVITSEPSDSPEFTFTVPQSGNYYAVVTVTDSASTVTTASGGEMTVNDKAQVGDANLDGKITAADARFALRCAAKLETYDESLLYALDVNGDGKVTAADARKILRISAKLEFI